MTDDLPRAFADITARLEDFHSLAVEGQRSDNSPDMNRVLIGQLRSSVAALDRTLRAMAAVIDECSR